jgi:hypothetical protein
MANAMRSNPMINPDSSPAGLGFGLMNVATNSIRTTVLGRVFDSNSAWFH